jgi:hypothetical protein
MAEVSTAAEVFTEEAAAAVNFRFNYHKRN